MSADDGLWDVWGDGTKPIQTGLDRRDAQLYVEQNDREGKMYIQGPEGEEFIYEAGKWQPV